MKQKIKKNIAEGMIISGLVAVVLGTLGSFINRSEIESLSSQKRRLLEYNNQTYSIALENPKIYNQNVAKINNLEEEIRACKESSGYTDLFLTGSSVLVGGIYFYPKDKRQKNN